MNNKELSEIFERMEKAKEYGEGVAELVFEDIPKLLAEIERLQNKVDKLTGVIYGHARGGCEIDLHGGDSE